jgi:hypothetical protein
MLEGHTLKGKLAENTSSVGAIGFKGEQGLSAYEIAVKNGYEGTEQDWIDHFGLDLSDYIQTSDVVNNLSSTSTNYPLSAYQGRYLKNYIDTYRDNVIGDNTDLDTTSKIVVNAINEVNTKEETNKSNVGTLASLNTTNKTNLVSAINEVLGTSASNSKMYYNGVLTDISTLQIELINTSITATDTDLNNYPITFTRAFSSLPYVLISCRGTVGYVDKMGVRDITTTGCNIQYRHTTTAGTVYYTLLVIGKS